MGRWASKDIRKRRAEIAIDKYQRGWQPKDIANHLGIGLGSVSHIINAYRNRGENNVSTTH